MDNIQWDDANTEHIARHSLEPEDVEEALEDPDGKSDDARNTPLERRYAFIGATVSGRILFVVYVLQTEVLRVVTARGATTSEKRRYRR